MRSSTRSLVTVSLLALSIAACGSSGGSDEAAATPPGRTEPGADADGGVTDGRAPPATPIGTPTTNEDLNEKLGVFVSPNGADNAEGSRSNPLARIQPAIDLGKALGKRVYVCTGVYHEALTIADSISVIGGLDCSSATWKTGAPRSRVESPTSPAITAKDITHPTRLEGLDVVAPAAKTPGGSSVGLRAESANALVIATSRIAAGDGAKGDDGTEGPQLVQSPLANGKPMIRASNCGSSVLCISDSYKPPQNLAGTNDCGGNPLYEAQPGGYGGTGGKWEVYLPEKNSNGTQPPAAFRWLLNNPLFDAEAGVTNRTSAPGADGAPGANAAPLGTITREGFTPSDGTAGTNGTRGFGGKGGYGLKPQGFGDTVGARWFGNTGASGGAGGCPGLAGTAGKGGGASIAALLVDSALTLEGAELVAGSGGAGGLGSFGSLPTPGGAAGDNTLGYPETAAQPGGRGGIAGISGNGGSGPSIGLVHFGAPPKVTGATAITPGAGGQAIPERTRDSLGVPSTIPATPAGLSKDVLAL